MASDYKTKYMDIRAKLKDATDVAFRLGYEKGMKDGTQAAQMQAMAQQQQQQAAMMGGAPGQPGQDPSMGGDPSMQGGDPSMGGMPGGDPSQDPSQMEGAGAPGDQEMADAGGGSELDQHIGELEGLVAKGEKPSVIDIRKAVQAIAGIRKAQKNVWAQKAEKIIPAQKKVVDDILKKWDKQAEKPSEGLEAIIKQHGLKIGE
jgi:hypothetical protein